MRVRLPVLLVILAVQQDTSARRALPDYRYFRALAFEQPSFDVDAWLATHLTGDGYAERVRRVYMDLLRLEVGPMFQFVPPALVLRRHEVLGPDGPVYVYFRRGQRR